MFKNIFKTRSNCAKCIDVYEKGLRSEQQFKESLKKLTSKEKSFINNRIRDRRKIIHKKFGTIFRDEAGTMLSVIENVANKKKMNKMKQQMQLRDEQQLMNQWEKTRLLQKKYRRNKAAKKIQTMFKTRKSRKKRSPKMSTKLDRYQQNMLEVLDADKSIDPEDIDFRNQMADVEKAKNILTHYNPDAYRRNIKNIKAHRNKKSKRTGKRLSQSAREAGITPYRYSARADPKADDDFTPPPKKKGLFENIFGSPNKGGRRTRKRRKRKRTRKRRKRRRRKTRK